MATEARARRTLLLPVVIVAVAEHFVLAENDERASLRARSSSARRRIVEGTRVLDRIGLCQGRPPVRVEEQVLVHLSVELVEVIFPLEKRVNDAENVVVAPDSAQRIDCSASDRKQEDPRTERIDGAFVGCLDKFVVAP